MRYHIRVRISEDLPGFYIGGSLLDPCLVYAKADALSVAQNYCGNLTEWALSVFSNKQIIFSFEAVEG